MSVWVKSDIWFGSRMSAKCHERTHAHMARALDPRNLELAAARSAKPRGQSSLYQGGVTKYPRALGLWNARRTPKRWRNKNAEAYVPLPQATRRRVCVGLYVIHFLLCDFPALGCAIVDSENLSRRIWQHAALSFLKALLKFIGRTWPKPSGVPISHGCCAHNEPGANLSISRPTPSRPSNKPR
jgi:hypothetical protein